MKQLLRLTGFVLGIILLCYVQEAAANVYASQLKATNPDGSPFDGDFGDGTGIRFSFILNDNATAVSLAVKEIGAGTVVYKADLGAMNRGPRSTTWNGAGAQAGKSYLFEITAGQPNLSNTDWKIFHDSGSIGIFSRGADLVRDMNSPLFGLIYAPNTGGTFGKGITVFTPDGGFKALLAADVSAGGATDWGAGSQTMLDGLFDEDGRFYVSAIPFGEVRRLNADNSITAVITGVPNPKGLGLVGEGADLVLYIAHEKRVVRAAIGNQDVFNGIPEVVAEFSNAYPRAVALDDDGYLYISLREGNDLASNPLGLYKLDISGTLPVNESDAAWTIGPELTFRLAEIEIDHGTDRNSSADDILYYSTRAGSGSSGDGVWRVADINVSGVAEVRQLISEIDLYGGDNNINERAGIALDPAGNIVLMENSNEHVFFISPPGEGATNSFTTIGRDTIIVSRSVGVAEAGNQGLPEGYRLEHNYPNPFNPETTIKYRLAKAGFTRVTIFNAVGREVRTLVARHQAAGEYHVTWDGRDELGNTLSSGVYTLMMQSGEFRQYLRMTLMK